MRSEIREFGYFQKSQVLPHRDSFNNKLKMAVKHISQVLDFPVRNCHILFELSSEELQICLIEMTDLDLQELDFSFMYIMMSSILASPFLLPFHQCNVFRPPYLHFPHYKIYQRIKYIISSNYEHSSSRLSKILS